MSKNRHHRKPKSKGGGNGKNIVRVNKERHAAWHCLFQDMSPYQIARIINRYWIDRDYVFICVRRSDLKDSDDTQ